MYVTSDIEDRPRQSYSQCVGTLSLVFDEIFSPLSVETLPVLRSLRPSRPPVRSRSSAGGLLQLWQPGTQAQSVPAQRWPQGWKVSSPDGSSLKRINVNTFFCLFQFAVICTNRPVSVLPLQARIQWQEGRQRCVSEARSQDKSKAEIGSSSQGEKDCCSVSVTPVLCANK